MDQRRFGKIEPVDSLSPLDGRYAIETQELREVFSERALIKERLIVEIEWLISLCNREDVPEAPPLTDSEKNALRAVATEVDNGGIAEIKGIEASIRHDTKAVELYLVKQVQKLGHEPLASFVHFGLTSEDVVNVSYARAIQRGATVWGEACGEVIGLLQGLTKAHASTAMLGRTHGQPASATSFGKEMGVYAYRLGRQRSMSAQVSLAGKWGGAVGNFNALVVSHPDVPWREVAQGFIEDLGLRYESATTQVGGRDAVAEQLHSWMRANTVALDLCIDVSLYSSFGYLNVKVPEGSVGSSTMPHKANPIAFENAEGNLMLANEMMGFLAATLPTSRLQRDLSDSTVMRNCGVALGYAVLGLKSLARGLQEIEVDPSVMLDDLSRHPEILGEAIQTVMRKRGQRTGFDELMKLTQGQKVTRQELNEFVTRHLPESADREALLQLEPHQYVGLAAEIADED